MARGAIAMALASFLALFVVQAVADPPQVSTIVEPALGAAPVNAEDVHMVAEFSDADGDAHLCTDWEIWSLAPAEPVWQAHCANGPEKVHIHLGDGAFVDSHAGRAALLPDTAYELRVRFRDDSGEPAEEWSDWETRPFSTRVAGPQGNEATAWVARPGYAVDVFASDLQLPVNIAMVPEPGPHPGDPLMYVTELYGTVKVIARDGTVRDYATDLLNFDPTGAFPGSGEIGLTGIVVDPDSGDVFVSLVYEDTASSEDPKPHYPKVLRLQSDERGLKAEGQTTVLDMIGERQWASHQISNLTIGPDNNLYVHNGDGFDPSSARNLDSFRGKVLRMTLAGEAPADNPFYDVGDGIGPRDYVFAAGFRNPFGGAWRLSDGAHYAVDNGPATDRLARVIASEDYLWAGADSTMTHLASYNWFPSHAPVNIEFVEPGRFGGSGFPAHAMGHAFVTESGATWASGPQDLGKRIVEIGLDGAGNRTSGPETLVEYAGVGKATTAGLAAGPDGLYFTDLYKDTGFASPIDRGANVLRVRCLGECPLPGSPRSAPRPPTGEAPPLRVRRFRAQPKAFVALAGAKRLAKSLPAKRGTTFRYSLSHPASVRIRIAPLKGTGRRGELAAPGQQGPNRKSFAGRLGSRWLPPGHYRATLHARDREGRTATARARFRVVGPCGAGCAPPTGGRDRR